MGHFRSYRQARDAVELIEEEIEGKTFRFKPFPSVDFYERFQTWLEAKGEERFSFDQIPDELVDALFLESLSKEDYADLKKRVSLVEFPLIVRDMFEQTGLVQFEQQEAEAPNRQARRSQAKTKASRSRKRSGTTSARSKLTSPASTGATS